MSRLVPALFAVLVVGGIGAALWSVLGDGGSAPAPAKVDETPRRPPDGGDGTPVVPKEGPPAPGKRPAPPQEPPRKPWDEGPPLVEPEGEPVPGAGLRFPFPQWPETALVDWTRVGQFARMAQSRLRRVAIRLREGDSVGKLRGELDMSFAPVGHAARVLVAASLLTDFDPMSPFGSIQSFPPFLSNAIAGTLEAWKRPLTDEQAANLVEPFQTYASVWLQNRPMEGQERSLDTVTAIARARAALQERIEAVLTEPQREALWPPETKDRLCLDMFSPATILRDRVVLVEGDADNDFRHDFSQRLLAECAMGHLTIERIQKPVAEWFETMPESFRKGAQGALARAGLLTFDEIAVSLYEVPKLQAMLEAAGSRRDPRWKRLKKVLVPVQLH